MLILPTANKHLLHQKIFCKFFTGTEKETNVDAESMRVCDWRNSRHVTLDVIGDGRK